MLLSRNNIQYFILLLLFCAPIFLSANQVKVESLVLISSNRIIVKLSWENAFKYDTATAPGNHDAIYCFIKKQDRDGIWSSLAISNDVTKIQREKQMPFISTPERVGIRVGMRKGIKTALKMKFGEMGLTLMPAIEKVYEEGQLQAILDLLETGTTLEEIRRALPKSQS